MSLDNPYSMNSYWKVDPDGRQDRQPGPVITRMMTEEEKKKYENVKGQSIGTVISNFNNDKVKQIRMREREEKEMKEEIINNEPGKSDEVVKETIEEQKPDMKLSKAAVRALTTEGKSIDEITACFLPGWHGKPGLLKAKIVLFLSDIKPKTRKKKDVKQVSDVNTNEEHVEVSEYDKCPICGKDLVTDKNSVTKCSRYDCIYNGPQFLTNANHNIDRPLPVETGEYAGKEDTAKIINEGFKTAGPVLPDEDIIINYPEHYVFGNIETMDFIQDKLTPEEFEGFCKGVILQYVIRYRHKGGLSDLKKAKWYLDRIIKAKESAQ